MCVFPDGASIGAITAVLGTEDWDEAAEELVAASVWRLTGRRWTTHPLVRADRARSNWVTSAASSSAGPPGACAIHLRIGPGQIRRLADRAGADQGDHRLVRCPSSATWSGPPSSPSPPAIGTSVSKIATALFQVFQIRGHWSDAEHLYTFSLAAAPIGRPRRPGPGAQPSRLGLPAAGPMEGGRGGAPRQPGPLAGDRRPASARAIR